MTLLNNHITTHLECQPSLKSGGRSTLTVTLTEEKLSINHYTSIESSYNHQEIMAMGLHYLTFQIVSSDYFSVKLLKMY